LDALTALFESLWHRALPLHSLPTGRTDPQRLITLLLSGLTDEAIAHQLNVSHRTIQRRVASLMSSLSAHTRFQAGIQAALLRPRRPDQPA
jgi:DNA-binding NarL/FixJ family response regulator